MASSHADTPAASSTIAGMHVNAGDYASVTARLIAWAHRREARYVCVANVHMVMETRDSPAFRDVVNGADFVTSDGMPLVWLLRRYGHPKAERVYGPDLTLWLCEAAAREGIPVAFFGGTEATLATMTGRLTERFPGLKIAAAIAPPFGAALQERDEEFTTRLASCGAALTFIGLGCPKQERWMAAHRDRIPTVLVGVGAAFNFHAGAVKQAPARMQRLGLEWVFRFAMEPRRLWKRYLWHNPRFIRAVVTDEFRGHNRPARTLA